MRYLEGSFVIITASIFPVLLIFNYFFLKRWKNKSLIEKIMLAMFTFRILFNNFLCSFYFPKSQEKIAYAEEDNIRVIIKEVMKYRDVINTLYIMFVLIFCIVLLINIKNKKIYSNTLFFILTSIFTVFFIFNIVKSSSLHMFELTEGIQAVNLYTLYAVSLFVLAGYLFFDIKSNKRLFIVYIISSYLILAISAIILSTGLSYPPDAIFFIIFIISIIVLPIFKIKEFNQARKCIE